MLVFLVKNSNNGCLVTLESNGINDMKKSYPGLRNISDSSNVEISQPKLPGNQKHPRKLEEKINKLGKKAERIMIKPTTVSRIPEVGIRKLEDKSFRKSMLPQKRGSNQKIVFHEKK